MGVGFLRGWHQKGVSFLGERLGVCYQVFLKARELNIVL